MEAPDFPEFLRKHYVEMWDEEPDGEFHEPRIDVLACMRANDITPEVRSQLLPKARKTAQEWFAKEQAG